MSTPEPSRPTGSVTPLLPPPDTQQGAWTAERQAAFLRELAATHCVSSAARAVGMSRQSAYKLRARLKGEPFDCAWQCAFRRQYDALAQAAVERAIHGVEVPHFYKGELIHTSRRYDDRAAVALLALRAQLTVRPAAVYSEQNYANADDFEELVDRVECGGERWSRYFEDDEFEDDEFESPFGAAG